MAGMDSYPPDYLNTTIESGDNGLSNPLLRYVGNHSTLDLLLQCQDINCLGVEKTSNALIGKLYTTCSEQEILQKINVNTANDLERGRDKQVNPHLALKSFQRSDASRTFTPEEIRPLIWCRRTLYYILCHFVDADIKPKKYLMRDDYTFIDVYNFLRDRLRSIWQDLTVQHCTKHRAYIECFEISIRFLLYSHYKLLGHPEYDSIQNLGLINTCLEKLMNGYFDVRNYRNVNGISGEIYDILVYSSPYQAEFWSYQLLIAIKNIQNSGGGTIFVDLCKKMPHDVYKSPLVQFAVNAYISAYNYNIYRYLKLIGDATPLQAILLNMFLGIIRTRWLRSIVNTKVSRPPISFKTFAKYFEHINPSDETEPKYEAIKLFAERYSIQTTSDNNGMLINLTVLDLAKLEEDIYSFPKVYDKLEISHWAIDSKLAGFETRQKIVDPDFECVESPKPFDATTSPRISIELAQLVPMPPQETVQADVMETHANNTTSSNILETVATLGSVPASNNFEGFNLPPTASESNAIPSFSLDTFAPASTPLDVPQVNNAFLQPVEIPFAPPIQDTPCPPVIPAQIEESPVPPIDMTKINQTQPKPNYNVIDFNKSVVEKINLPKVSTNHEIFPRVTKTLSFREESIKEINAIQAKFNKRQRIPTYTFDLIEEKEQIVKKPKTTVKRQKSCLYRKVSILFNPIRSTMQYMEKLSLTLYYYKQLFLNCFYDISNIKLYASKKPDPILSGIKLRKLTAFHPFQIKTLLLRLHFVCNINQSIHAVNGLTPAKYPIHLCALFVNEMGFNSTSIFKDTETNITKFGTFSAKKPTKKMKKFSAVYSLSRSPIASNNLSPVNGFVLVITNPIELKMVDGDIVFSNKQITQWLKNINILTIKPIIENIKDSHGGHGLVLFYILSIHSNLRINPHISSRVEAVAVRINKKVYKHLTALASIYLSEITLSGKLLGSKKKSQPFIVDMLGYINGKEVHLNYEVIHKSMRGLVTHCFNREGLNLSLHLPNQASLRKSILQLLLNEHDWESENKSTEDIINSNLKHDFTVDLTNALYNKISNFYAFNSPSIRKSMFDCVRDSLLRERSGRHHILNHAIRKLVSRDYSNKFANLRKDIEACIQASIGDLYIDNTHFQIAPRNKKLMIMQYIYSCIRLITKGLDNLEIERD